jgi:hypothetical protein
MRYETTTGIKLGRWAGHQREQYHKKDFKYMTPKRIQLLEQLEGWQWKLARGGKSGCQGWLTPAAASGLNRVAMDLEQDLDLSATSGAGIAPDTDATGPILPLQSKPGANRGVKRKQAWSDGAGSGSQWSAQSESAPKKARPDQTPGPGGQGRPASLPAPFASGSGSGSGFALPPRPTFPAALPIFADTAAGGSPLQLLASIALTEPDGSGSGSGAACLRAAAAQAGAPRQAKASIWEVAVQVLRDYVEEHGHTDLGLDFETEEGFQLGHWVKRQRDKYQAKDPSLTHEYIKTLEGLPAWHW